MRRFVAPGKVVVLGEYAVLDGAPAVVAAVNRGVACETEPRDVLLIHTPGSDDTFVRPALEGLGASGSFHFEPHNPANTASKVGLGSSASATVVATYAALAAKGAPDLDEVFAHAFATHHAVQGSGSGIDVAASTYGGVLRYLNERATPLPSVDLLVIWSGGSASTGPRVQRYLAWAERGMFVETSRYLVDQFAHEPIVALREGGKLLHAMSRAAGIDYATPALTRITELAEACGGAAKPSGAGGGDCAVALLPDRDARVQFIADCAAHGLPVIPVQVANGVHEVNP